VTRFFVHEPRRAEATLVLAHGAGAGQSHPWMQRYAAGLAARGVRVVTFDFPYVEAGRRAPDRPSVLEETYRGVVLAVRDRFEGPLFIGGKSMGGRIASQIAAKYTLPVEGLVFFGYPLHPPGRPAVRRDAHLPEVAAPMLFVSGTRDGFATEPEMKELVRELGRRASLLAVAGGDHSLEIPKRSGESQSEVEARVWDAAAAFVLSLSRSRSPRRPRRRPRARPRRREAGRSAS
jgi:predicted alpha/beta-hydrolase family hydrolase